MTKTIVLGEQKDKAINKPIEFFTRLNILESDDVKVESADTKPYEWNYIELICKNYTINLDLIFVYENADDRSSGILMIGRWNDGVAK